MKKESNGRPALHWIWAVSDREKRHIWWLVLMQILLGISSVGSAWLLRGVIDQAVAGTARGFWLYIAVLAVIIVFQIALRAVVRFLTEYAKASIENRFKKRLFSTLLKKDYGTVTAVHSGEWMNRLTSDTVIVADGVTSIVPEATGMLVKLAGALALILYLIPGFAWILIPGGAFLVVLTYGFRKVLKRLHKRVQEADGRLRVFLSERLSSLLVVRSFAAQTQTEEEASQKMEQHHAARMKRSHFSNLCNIGFAVLMRGAYLLGVIYCGYGILTSTMSYGTFTAVLQLIGQIQSPFANITGYLPKYYAMLASAERLMEIEAAPDAAANGILTCSSIQELYQNRLKALVLEHAAFTYPPGEQTDTDRPATLQNLDLEIVRGEYIAFTGPSGCGKSTVLKLFMCLYPLDSGRRYLRCRDGSTLPLESEYMRLFAYVPQGNHLMSGTIRETVTFAAAKPPDDTAIWTALRIACAEEFVKELPEQLDTRLGERGNGLSEGQMQRLAIARAIYSEHPILMLDESTSALDEQTERALLANLRSMTDKTVLLVTHRPSALAVCDRHVTLGQNGIIIGRANYD